MRFSPLIRHSGFSLLLIASSAMAAGASDATTPIVPPAPAPVAVAPPAPNPVTREADAEAQFHVMAGEMAAGRNQPGIAASEFIAALQRADDAELAKRATALALAANDENLALQAAPRWLQVETPRSEEPT